MGPKLLARIAGHRRRGKGEASPTAHGMYAKLARARLRLALPVIERAAPGPEKADTAEANWACWIGDTRADFSRIGILDDLDPVHRRDAEIDKRFGT